MSTRAFALALGIVFLVLGIAGFVPGLVTQTAPAADIAPGCPDAAPAAMASHG